ncbi:hypothetical protein DIS24_g7590 [Lasiodiplodia hormozganensis]|uniref:Uncharacterized protein n=1 Tax=Lasiodiplodia hormozganensis TaxID=869390 RepID=A0AA39Y900_9PEZI|nr:hypothetical protein DIS24_g7590 [Lasiodiplodia hormozganensis]
MQPKPRKHGKERAQDDRKAADSASSQRELMRKSSSSSASSSAAAAAAAPSSKRLLFVEVRGPRGKRQSGLRYDRTASELKSHVMLVASKDKRERQASEREILAVGELTPPRLSLELSPQQTDPFNMLPVEGTPEQHAAIRYYFEHYPGPTPMTHDSLVCHKNKCEREKMQWSRVQFSFVQDEKISYYIMLFIWQVMKNLSSDMDYETRKYWAQVLQIVREEMPIGKTGTDISESYVAMIAGLGVAETWMGNFTNANHHKNAMLKLVAARGGFSTFGSMAQRALKWCEFYPCACLTLRPTLPQLPVHNLHPDVIKTAGTGHRRTMEHLPDQLEQSELDMIFFQLHTVALVQLSAPQPAFASVLDDLEHRLLVELFDRKEKFEASPSADPTDLVYAGMLQAAQMCVFGMMTFTRKETPMYGVFAATLRRILDVPNVGQPARG